MKFNSQICTTREQSERLLSLGLKRETADMVWTHAYFSTWVATASENPLYEESESVPAWSLHRLIEMADTAYLNEGRRDDDNELWFCLDRCYCWNNHASFYATNLYDSIINCIEWLIKKGYFPKEYLVNQDEIEELCKGVLEYLDYIREEE